MDVEKGATESNSPAEAVQDLRRETDRLLVQVATKPLIDENYRLRREILLIEKDRQDLREQNKEAGKKARHTEGTINNLTKGIKAYTDRLLITMDAWDVEYCKVRELEKERADLKDAHALERIDISRRSRLEIESLENELAATYVENMRLRQALETRYLETG